jgi:predicted metal-dependent phosphoesterase TrpH
VRLELPILKLDLHVHTVRSPDAHTRIEDLPEIIRTKGLDGVAITEHNNFDPPHLTDALILPGIEVSSRDGHVIALGAKEGIPSRLSADETIKRIHDQEGIAIIPHPFDPVSERVRIAHLSNRPDAVETVNADALSFYICNWLARRQARELGLPEVGGSDSHIPQSVGDAYSVVDSPSCDLKDILLAIKAGKVHAEGKPTSVMNKMRKLRYKFS